jgi:hypothetical protein
MVLLLPPAAIMVYRHVTATPSITKCHAINLRQNVSSANFVGVRALMLNISGFIVDGTASIPMRPVNQTL